MKTNICFPVVLLVEHEENWTIPGDDIVKQLSELQDDRIPVINDESNLRVGQQ